MLHHCWLWIILNTIMCTIRICNKQETFHLVLVFTTFELRDFKLTSFKFIQIKGKNLFDEMFRSFKVDFCSDVFMLIVIVDITFTYKNRPEKWNKKILRFSAFWLVGDRKKKRK